MLVKSRKNRIKIFIMSLLLFFFLLYKMSGIFIFNESFINDYQQEITEDSVRISKLIEHTKFYNKLQKGNRNCIDYVFKWGRIITNRGTSFSKSDYELLKQLLFRFDYGFCLEGGDRVRFSSRHRNITLDQSHLYYFYQANPDLKEKFPSYNIYNTGDIPKERDNWAYRLDEHYVVTIEPHEPIDGFTIMSFVYLCLIFIIVVVSKWRSYILKG